VINQRPLIGEHDCSATFRDWYYLKEELTAFALQNGISAQGGKADIEARIAAYLDDVQPPQAMPKRPKSKFDWANAPLSLETKITDNVSFGPNFRRFMKQKIGKKFVCNSDFMDWVRTKSGATLADAITVWHALEARKTDPDFETTIRPHNQYNQFTRDFLKDNPSMTLTDCRRVWKLKRARAGTMVYETSDRDLV
jgi:hypothetical protein